MWLLWAVAGLLLLLLLFQPFGSRARAEMPRPWSRSRLPSRRDARGSAGRARAPAPRLVITSRNSSMVAAPQAAEAANDGLETSAVGEIGGGERPRIATLGALTITRAKRSRRGLRASALELVAYLALQPGPVQRDEILEAIWPGEDPKRTRLRLHQAVRDARQLLGTGVASDRDRYWLDRKEVDVDVDELEGLLAAARADPERVQALLERALSLFAGEPLAGADYAWAQGEMRRLRATYVDLLERVGRGRLDRREARAALDAAERGLAVDALNEALWRLALEAESELGLREAVTERYERLRVLLDERLGLEPARDTRLLHRRLLAQQ